MWKCTQYSHDTIGTDTSLQALGTRKKAKTLVTFSPIENRHFIVNLSYHTKKVAHYEMNASSLYDLNFLFQIEGQNIMEKGYSLTLHGRVDDHIIEDDFIEDLF
ncbi:hypothetical protein AB9P05_13505 [Roseivirga sp. BDSF3-8]|uniref:hypothetical protein n=1 Tax=Roseivirga sp. BDSF3-8 TaxID=3241598 RepID=UPI003532734A